MDAAQLRIRPLYFEGDALNRVVSWTFTTDLLDPRRYLTHGQLVMTGMVWRRGAGDSEVFVAAVARSGGVALLAGEGLYGSVPDDLLAACQRHGLPLFAVPPEVSFASITAYISNVMANDRMTRVMASLARQRELITDVYQGHLLDDLITRASRELGRPIWVLTATGRQVIDPIEPLAEPDHELIISSALSADRLPVTITDSRGEQLIIFAVPGVDQHRATSWFLVVAGDWNEWHPLILDTANELTAVAGLYRVQRHGEVGIDRVLVDRLIEVVESDADSPQTGVYLRQAGMGAHHRFLVVVAEFPDHPELADLAVWLLQDAIAQESRPVVGQDGLGRATAFVPVDDRDDMNKAAASAAVRDQLTRSLRRVGPGLDDHVLRIGLSQSAEIGELGGALRSARFALAVPAADAAGQPSVQISDSEALTSAVQLLWTVPDHLRRVFVALVLGRVVEHDTRYNSQLLSTLSAFLDCGGSWVRTAEVTHLHLNTVRYRVGRIEELTGRDLGKTADRVDLYLALKLT